MLYYLLLIPAVLSTAWIYFLSPALSYWWLLPILIACFVAANHVYVLDPCALPREDPRHGARKSADGHRIPVREQPSLEL